MSRPRPVRPGCSGCGQVRPEPEPAVGHAQHDLVAVGGSPSARARSRLPPGCARRRCRPARRRRPRGRRAPAARGPVRPAARRRAGVPGPRRAPARTPPARATTATASVTGESSVRTGRRASLTIASMVRWSTAMCSWSRSASCGSSIASASSRSAVTGVRSRCDRSPTAAAFGGEQLDGALRQAVERPRELLGLLRAVHGGPAERSPSRSRCAVPATSSNGSLTRLPSHEASRRASSEQRRTEPQDAGPGADDAAALVGLGDLGAHDRRARVDQHRQQDPAAFTVDDGEGLAVAGAAYLGCLCQLGTGPQLPSVGEQHPGRGGTPQVEVVDELGQRRVVGEPRHQDPDAPGLLVGGGHRPVLGQGAHQQAQRDHERDHDRRRRGDDQP